MATATIDERDRCLLTAFDVELLRADLDTGQPRKCKACAIALAVRRAVGSWRFVDVAVDGRIIVRHPSGRHVEAIVEDPDHLEWLVSTIDAGRASAIEEQAFRIWCPFPSLAEVEVDNPRAIDASRQLSQRFRHAT